MLSIKSFGLGTAVIGSTLAAVSFAAAPAHAGVFGSISLSGQSTIVDSSATNYPATSTINFLTTDIDSATFDFLEVSEPPNITISSLVLSRVGATSSYTTPGQIPWINFGTQTIGSVTAGLTFNLDPATFTRIAFGSGSSVFEFADPRITGTFVFNGESIGEGFLSASKSFGSSSYQVSIQAVPEPITMLGAGAAAGLGAFFKRSSARKQGKDNNKA